MKTTNRVVPKMYLSCESRPEVKLKDKNQEIKRFRCKFRIFNRLQGHDLPRAIVKFRCLFQE